MVKKMQLEKSDSLTKGYTLELWDFTCINVTQNNLQELKEIWAQWDDEVRWLFYLDKVYSRAANVLASTKKLAKITEMSEQWVTVQIKQKGENKCIHWKNLRDQILAHPNTRKKVDVFALSIYGLVIFPKALGHVDEVVTDLFDQLDRRVTPVPAILAEMFRSLRAIRYTPLLVLRQYRSRQFIPVTQGLAECELSYRGNNYRGKIREMSNAWRQIQQMKRFTVRATITPEYHGWQIPSKLEIIKQDFEKRNAELEKKIEQMEAKKMNLRLDADV
ncbi:hypothetical protein Gotur_010966 [Gossypium turneri]